MPVPAAWGDISDVAASNSPAGSETVGPNMNAYLQAAFAYCKQLYEGQQNPTAAVTMNSQKLINLAAGVAGTDAVNMTQLSGYCILTGGWTVSGAVGFSAGVTFSGAVTVNASTSTSFTITGTAANSGPHINLYETTTGGRKYFRCISNQLQVINAAYNGIPLTLDDLGNLSVTGNMTAFSDERVKTDWEPVAPDFVDVLATIKSGTFSRTDIKMDRQAGVAAQSLRDLLPEAVPKGSDGMYSVAYGQAAMVACVELAKEVVALRRRLEDLEGGE